MSSVTGESTPADGLHRSWGVTSYDPWDPRITNANVWEIYRAMREAGPVVRSDAHGGFWSITRYEDIRKAASDFRTFSSQYGVVVGRKKEVRVPPLEYDRPEHTRFRKAMQAPFLRSRIGAFTDLVRSEVRALLDDLEARETFDIVEDLAGPLPLRIISDLLGMSDRQRQAQHQRIANALVFADRDAAGAADRAYYEFLMREVRARRTAPGDDFLTELLEMEVEGERFTEDEVARMARALALAGHHTTINGIASMLLRMAHPEQRDRLRQDPSSGSRVVVESLRVDPPIHLEARRTTQTAVVGDVEIPAGETVALLYASGNHDDEQYADPERFDPARQGPPHLSFGHGIHKCLGEHLSLLEMSVVLEGMVARFPGYGLVGEPQGTGLVYGHHMGWKSIPAVTG